MLKPNNNIDTTAYHFRTPSKHPIFQILFEMLQLQQKQQKKIAYSNLGTIVSLAMCRT